MARAAVAVLILVVLLLGNRSAGADTLEAQTILAGEEVAVDVHLPDLGQGRAIAVVAHGFTRSRKRHGELGRALAAAGIVAVVPDLPSTANHWANGRAIAELVTAIERGAFGLAAVPRAHILLIGTSAGGFASLLAAAELPGIAGWIGLDPVDRTGSAIAAAGRLQAPAVVLRARASPCNLFGSAHGIADAAPRLRRELRLDGVTHCDFESPTNRLCSVACGGSSAAAAARVVAITVREALDLLASMDAPTHSDADRPTTDPPPADRPAADRPDTGQPDPDRPAADRGVADRSDPDRRDANRAVLDRAQ